MSHQAQLDGVLWATRGRTWGFRFLLDGGAHDPLITYEQAFGESRDSPSVLITHRDRAALRFPDPLGRRDSAGRVIPHEFVIEGNRAAGLTSVDSGVGLIWPMVASGYDSLWGVDHPPTASEIEHALDLLD